MSQLPGRVRSDDDDHDDDDRYLDLEQLARYSSLSVRTLQRYLKDPDHPLPHHLVRSAGRSKGRVLVSKRAFQAWLDHYKVPKATAPGDLSWIKVRD